jgi:GntR family transcriptional regulator/MocR family aminotransferase
VSIQWSGLGPELLVRLDRSSKAPLRAQLEHELRDAIRTQRLAPGERLPSTRELARELGLSRGLVQECYEQLLAEGYLSARTGSGTRVAEGPRPPAAVVAPVSTAPHAGAETRLAINFAPGRPDLASFPRKDWLWALREVSRTAPATEFGYGESHGSRRLREVLAAYLRRVRGAVVEPDQIVVCSGFAQGVNLVLRALKRDGARCVAFEDPGTGRMDLGGRWDLEAVSVAVDEHGLEVEALRRTEADVVLLTPAHQAPTGVVLAPDRRTALVQWARERGATIIEDDYDAEFRYDRDPVGALQGLDPDCVATVGTVSKSLAPAIRLGWVVSPPGLVGAIAEEKFTDDHGSPGLDQLALATLIESGRYDRHLRHMRAVYAGRRRALIEALAEHAPEIRLTGLAAGFHAVLWLPDHVDERDVVLAARERSVGLYPLSRYRHGGASRPPRIVLGFGDVTEPAIRRGIALIGDLLRGA